MESKRSQKPSTDESKVYDVKKNVTKEFTDEQTHEPITVSEQQIINTVIDFTITDFDALRDCHELAELDVQLQQAMYTTRHFDNISKVKRLTLHNSQIHLPILLTVCKELEELYLDNCTLSAAFATKKKAAEPVNVTVDNAQLCKLTLKSCSGLRSLTFASVHDKLTELTIVNCCL